MRKAGPSIMPYLCTANMVNAPNKHKISDESLPDLENSKFKIEKQSDRRELPG